MRESFIFYRSFYESIKELNDKQQYELYKAIMEYQFDNKENELEGITKAIFTLVKPQLEANNKRYENGRKGGAPIGNQNAKKTTKKQPKNNLETTKKQPNNNENVNVNENDNENNNVNDNKLKIYYKDNELNDLFVEFLQLRKKLKAVNSERAIKLLQNQLSKYDDAIKKEMINQSIVNSWKSVYEIKQKKETMSEKLRREIQEAEEEERRANEKN